MTYAIVNARDQPNGPFNVYMPDKRAEREMDDRLAIKTRGCTLGEASRECDFLVSEFCVGKGCKW